MTRDTREIVREEPWMAPQILAALVDGALTIPELAAAIDCPTDETTTWVMGLRRFGLVHELPGANGDGYFRYEATVGEGP